MVVAIRGKVVFDQTYRDWISGLKDMDSLDGEAIAIWEQATENFFGRTQEYAHILTGAMKESGRYQMQVGGLRIDGEVIYGNAEAFYTVYELARGGDHDFFELAMNDVESHFQEQFERALKAQIENKIS